MTAPSSPVPAVEAVKFRKKPVVIEAFQLTDKLAEVPDWFETTYYEHAVQSDKMVLFDDGSVSIKTLEGAMLARPGDWIIRGVKGELYPCKPDIFAETYEPVSTPTPHAAAEPDTMGDPWVDTRLVSFDDTVMFGQGYDGFDQWDDFRMEMHVPGAGSYAVWGSGKRWSFYGGPNGVMAFERFGSRAEAQREAEDYALSVSEWGRTHHALRTRAETAEAQLATLRAEKPPVGIPAKLRPVLETIWRYGEIYDVKGVVYPMGSHRECLNKLASYLWPEHYAALPTSGADR